MGIIQPSKYPARFHGANTSHNVKAVGHSCIFEWDMMMDGATSCAGLPFVAINRNEPVPGG
jgi:hypothetical protein